MIMYFGICLYGLAISATAFFFGAMLSMAQGIEKDGFGSKMVGVAVFAYATFMFLLFSGGLVAFMLYGVDIRQKLFP